MVKQYLAYLCYLLADGPIIHITICIPYLENRHVQSALHMSALVHFAMCILQQFNLFKSKGKFACFMSQLQLGTNRLFPLGFRLADIKVAIR